MCKVIAVAIINTIEISHIQAVMPEEHITCPAVSGLVETERLHSRIQEIIHKVNIRGRFERSHTDLTLDLTDSKQWRIASHFECDEREGSGVRVRAEHF